jgi:hypothetical protein
MDEWTINTPNPKCLLFFKIDLLTDFAALCLTDLINSRYILSWLVFSTQHVNCCPHGQRNYTCVLLPLQLPSDLCRWHGNDGIDKKITLSDLIVTEPLFFTSFLSYLKAETLFQKLGNLIFSSACFIGISLGNIQRILFLDSHRPPQIFQSEKQVKG